MSRRLPLFALALLLAATPALARRRAVLAGAPGHCLTGILDDNAFTQIVATDDASVYWIDDDDGALRRVAKSGGASEQLATLDEWFPLSMTVDDTRVYIGALPFEALFSPQPGVILSIPKSGGTLEVLISGVSSPFDVETDATHLYWAASGTLDIQNESIAADGKIERALKSGASRQTLAQDLSAPLDLALDGDAVWFGETGVATGDTTVGLFVVQKSGGAVTTIDSETASAYITPVGAALVVLGAHGSVENGLFVIRKDRGGVRTLVDDEFLVSGARIFEGTAYYLSEGDESYLLYSIPVIGGTPTLVRDDVYFTDDFEVDACAITLGTVDGVLERVKR
jgi:hypothetical protein